MASKKRPRGDRKKHRQVHCNLCADAEKSLEHALPAVEIAQNSVIHRLHHLHRLAAAEAQVGLQWRRAQPAGRSTGIHRLKIDHVAVDAVAQPARVAGMRRPAGIAPPVLGHVIQGLFSCYLI